ncbi:hypothetical protein PM082_004864 [Marasmius tenuissimus]|nr:hypothetical protein PM082_004864 [Marasmius tenuissimus]
MKRSASSRGDSTADSAPFMRLKTLAESMIHQGNPLHQSRAYNLQYGPGVLKALELGKNDVLLGILTDSRSSRLKAMHLQLHSVHCINCFEELFVPAAVAFDLGRGTSKSVVYGSQLHSQPESVAELETTKGWAPVYQGILFGRDGKLEPQDDSSS